MVYPSRTDKNKRPLYDTRKHNAKGIEWRGYLYEPIPKLGKVARLMIVEDHDDYLIVSDYSRPCGWHEICKPTGELFVSKKIDVGRPTKDRIDRLSKTIVVHADTQHH